MKRAAQDERSQQRRQQHDRDHNGNFGPTENARAGSHGRNDQSNFTAGDHAATDAKAAHPIHARGQGGESATDQLANDGHGQSRQ